MVGQQRDEQQRYDREALLIHYWYILQKRKFAVALFVVILTITVVLGTMAATSYYSSSVALEISPRAPVIYEVNEVSEVVSSSSTTLEMRAYYSTQYRIIESRAVVGETLNRLREEHGIQDFDGHPKPIKAFAAGMTVRPDAETYLVDIHYEYPDPDKAALFANTLAEVYIEQNLSNSLHASEEALTWLQRQHDEYLNKKLGSDKKVLDYRQEHELIGIEESWNSSLVAMEDLQGAWGKAHTERVEAEATYNGLMALSQNRGWLALANHLATENGVLQELLGRHQEHLQERSSLLTRYKEQHPKLVQINTEITGLESQVREQVDAHVAGKRAALQVVSRREDALAKELENTKAAVQLLEQKLIQLELLKGEAERNELFYKNLDMRMSEVDLSQLIKSNNIRIVDRAYATESPVRPKMAVNVVMGLVLGLFGGCALAFFMEYLDSTVKSREDVEAVVGMPFIGVVPRIDPEDQRSLIHERDRNIFVAAMPRSAVAESLRSIRTNLMFRAGQRPLKRLLITSAVPREGKSFISSNLSSLIAMTGSKVLLIDSDLRRPSLHKLFKIPNEIGLSNVLIGQMEMAEVIQEVHVPGLHVVTSGPSPPNPAELLGGDQFEELLERMIEYDLIVIDSPPVSVVADPLMLSGLVDGVMVVIEANRTSRSLVVNTRSRLGEVNAKLLGAVVNKLNIRNAGYGYYYYYDGYHDYHYEPDDPDAPKPLRPDDEGEMKKPAK